MSKIKKPFSSHGGDNHLREMNEFIEKKNAERKVMEKLLIKINEKTNGENKN